MDDQPNMATGSNMTAKGSVSLKNSLAHLTFVLFYYTMKPL